MKENSEVKKQVFGFYLRYFSPTNCDMVPSSGPHQVLVLDKFVVFFGAAAKIVVKAHLPE